MAKQTRSNFRALTIIWAVGAVLFATNILIDHGSRQLADAGLALFWICVAIWYYSRYKKNSDMGE